MKKILLITVLLLSSPSCSAGSETNNAVTKQILKHNDETPKSIRARITYYCSEKIYGSRVSQPDVKKAVSGKTIAAHPDFKFGTKIDIPGLKNKVGNGKFVVQDRGPAVTRKTASHGNSYVFDIFCSSRSEMNRLARIMPRYMDVAITN